MNCSQDLTETECERRKQSSGRRAVDPNQAFVVLESCRRGGHQSSRGGDSSLKAESTSRAECKTRTTSMPSGVGR
jgi:hypothetical protein